MVQFNFFRREVNCKIVYYGPGLSGKTTNLEVIHQKTPTSERGEFVSIATEQDRTLFFDFMPVNLGTVAGMKTKLRLFTVPGQVFYNSTRKLVLQGADGIIFVADSQRERLQDNLESLRNLEENLAEHGISIKDIPLVIQWNKRDLPDIMDIEELEKLLNYLGVPSFPAIATTGEGVFPTIKKCATLVLESVSKKASEANKTGAGVQFNKPGSPRPVSTPEAKGPTPLRRAGTPMPSDTPRFQRQSAPPAPGSTKPIFKKFKKFTGPEKEKPSRSGLAKPTSSKVTEEQRRSRRATTKPEAPPQPIKPIVHRKEKKEVSLEQVTTRKAEIKVTPEVSKPEIVAGKKAPAKEPTGVKRKLEQQQEQLPIFEQALSEDAGRPGAIERVIAQSVWAMKVIQVTIGLKFILIANILDTFIKTITSYVDGIFQAWKTYRTVQRRMERSEPDYQIEALAEDLKILRLQLSRLFFFAGFRWEEESCPKSKDWLTPSFPLKLVIEVRGQLDDMKRDLSLLTPTQIQQTMHKSIADFLVSLIPNPADWFSSLKDIFILTFLMKYSRADIEKMYVDMIITYQAILELLAKDLKEAKTNLWGLSGYEQQMCNRVKARCILEDSGDIEKCIEECKLRVQRLIQMLCNAGPMLNPRKWSRKDLLLEIQKVPQEQANPICALELERWLTKETAKVLNCKKTKQEKKLRWLENRSWKRKYKWLDLLR